MMSKIRFRLLVYFAGALLMFSIVLGVLFYFLLSHYNVAQHKHEMEIRAISIAETLTVLFEINAPGVPDIDKDNHRQIMQGMEVSDYLHIIDDIAMSYIWVVNRDLEQISRSHGQSSLRYQDLPPGAEDVIMQTLNGKTTFSESFDPLLSSPSITAVTPILLSNNEVAGAVLLHEEIDLIADDTVGVLMLLVVGMIAAIMISFIFASLLAGRFTNPLAKMKAAALRVSGGDYTTVTGIQQNDEIGELAQAFDSMTEKLGAASIEVEKLEMLRRDFISSISHELRTPVTVVRGSLEALCDGVVSHPEKVREYHRQMLSESIFLERLVSDLLELARLQNPSFVVEKSDVDLKALTEDAARCIRRVATKKNVRVNVTCREGEYLLFGDYGRLRQMLIIVLDNAVKFSPDGETVEVRLTSDSGSFVLTVCDNGTGISAEDLPHVFERFYKQRSEQNKSGTGLGLAIAKQIAERHGASIEIRSDSADGAEVVITFTCPDTLKGSIPVAINE